MERKGGDPDDEPGGVERSGEVVGEVADRGHAGIMGERDDGPMTPATVLLPGATDSEPASGRNRVLAPGRVEVDLALEGLPGRAPGKVHPGDRGDPWRERRATVRQLGGETGAPGQKIVQRQRPLVPYRPGNLGLEECSTGDQG